MPKENREDKIDIKSIYGKVCMLKPEEFLQEIQVGTNGLTQNEAKQRQEKYGKNQVKQAKPKKWYEYLWQSFISPFNLILEQVLYFL